MSDLKRVSSWVGKDVKAALVAAAKAHGHSESSLLGLLINTFLERNPAPPPVSQEDEPEGKEDRVTARFTLDEGRALASLAAKRNMKRGTYLAALFRSHARLGVYLPEAELTALREASRELAALGRNVNQIARALNTSLDNAHVAMSLDFQHLGQLIASEREAVKTLIKASQKSWGEPDEH